MLGCSDLRVVFALALGACGGGGGDGEADAGDAAVRVRTFTYDGRGVTPDAPFVGAAVFASSPEGMPLAFTYTDTAGEGTLAIPAGSTVTALFPYPTAGSTGAFVRSFVAVEPGDELRFGVDPRTVQPVPTAEFWTLSVPALPNAEFYGAGWRGSRPSFGRENPITVAHYPEWWGPPSDIDEVIALAYDNTTALIASAVLSPAMVTETGATLTAWNGVGSFRLVASGVPNIAGAFVRGVAAGELHGAQTGAMMRGGYSGDAAITIASIAERVMAFVEIEHDEITFRSVYAMVPAAAGGTSLDLGARLLPVVDQPVFDGAARMVRWDALPAGTTASPDAVWMQFSTQSEVCGGARECRLRWEVHGPPDVDAFRLPALPPELAAYEPGLARATGEAVVVMLVETGPWAGYDDARASRSWRWKSDWMMMTEDVDSMSTSLGVGPSM